MLKIKRLSKSFGSLVAVDDLSFDVPRGQMLGVIGRSGAGKSTLLRMINRLVEPTSGDIFCEDAPRADGDVHALRGGDLCLWRQRCAMVFQQFNLVPRLDVMTNVLMGRLSYQSTFRSLFTLFTPQERALAVMMLDRVEMAPFILKRADTLSGGQQQRVAIARALVQEPKLLLADEPIASLDPRSAARVMEILRAINREDGITVVCNLHTLDTARTYCDRLIGLRAGKIVFDGLPGELDRAVIHDIYGVDGEADLDETVTSTALPDTRRVSLESA